MKRFDRWAASSLVLAGLLMGVVFSQYHSVSSGVSKTVDRKQQFLSEMNSALGAIEELGFLQLNYPVFQELIESQKFINVHEPGNDSNSVNSESQRKVHWIKHLEAAKAHVGISDMRFEIYPYVPVGISLPDTKIAIGSESIILHVSLLHDGVLAELLVYLREYAPNPFVVSSIRLDRLADSVNNKSPDGIAAEITMTWHLIEVKEAGDEIAS